MFWHKTENFKNIIFAIMAILLILFIAQIKGIALLAFASFVIACSLNPLVDKLSNNKKISRGLASSIVIITLFLISILFLIPIISISIQEIQQLIENIPLWIDKTIAFLNTKMFMGKHLIDYIDLSMLTNSSSQIASNVVNKSVGVTASIMGIFTIIVTMSIIVFYMLYEKDLVKNAIVAIFPQKMKKRAKEVYEIIEQKVGGYIVAQILTMTSVAIGTAIGLIILKVPYAILLGLISGLLDIVLIIGPTIAFILCVLCAMQQGWVVVILTAIIFLCVQWSADNFVKPVVFGKFLNLHPLIIIFAFLISAQFLGVAGVILSPAIAALLLTLFDELYLKAINTNYKVKNCNE